MPTREVNDPISKDFHIQLIQSISQDIHLHLQIILKKVKVLETESPEMTQLKELCTTR